MSTTTANKEQTDIAGAGNREDGPEARADRGSDGSAGRRTIPGGAARRTGGKARRGDGSRDDSADHSVDDSVDDSVDFLLGYDKQEAIDSLKTAGKVLTALALTAALSALVVGGIRSAKERYTGGSGDRGRTGGTGGSAGRSGGRRRGGQVDLNHATKSELQRLPGVGNETALLILRHRPYRSVAEVKDVTGIRASAYRELRPHAKV